MRTPAAILLLVITLTSAVEADGPGDNVPDKVRPVPPAGIPVSEPDRASLQAAIDILGTQIEETRQALQNKPALLELLPDVQIFHNAARYALLYDEFFNAREIPVARALMKQGVERAVQLRQGQAPWNTATGLVVHGYRSKIDGSVQPYGLVVPATYQPGSPYRHRLDFWFHGRGETLSELNFLDGRQKSPGEFTPPNAFVLHLYGRYCNANRFAGEVDLFEALDNVKKRYPIDEHRLVVRGFSMGGAACWQFATHYPSLWAAAAPGAGFSETADFLKVFQREKLQPTWYEQKLWHLYDSTDYAANLQICPTVAYSGEIDQQKQAADMMAAALKKENMTLMHVIGPNTPHRYHPVAREEINRRIDGVLEAPRPITIEPQTFTTWTLRYHQMPWGTIDGLEQHWERARLSSQFSEPDLVRVKSENVSAFTLSLPSGSPLPPRGTIRVLIDGNPPAGPPDGSPILSDRSWQAHFRKVDGKWQNVASSDDGKLRKRHGLQGPIDDAFMDSFLMVRPTGKPLNERVGAWCTGEMKHAIEHWRKQFRGEARVKSDEECTMDDFNNHNLVLWGDPSSNRLLARIADKLPIRWDGKEVRVANRSYSAEDHAPVLIYPNPLNPKRYVVLNSGFTFREYDYLNNARQTPKLPDWAIIDLKVPVSSRAPGGVAAAGFFGEQWELLDR